MIFSNCVWAWSKNITYKFHVFICHFQKLNYRHFRTAWMWFGNASMIIQDDQNLRRNEYALNTHSMISHYTLYQHFHHVINHYRHVISTWLPWLLLTNVQAAVNFFVVPFPLAPEHQEAKDESITEQCTISTGFGSFHTLLNYALRCQHIKYPVIKYPIIIILTK